jgi:hypothetical protein
LVLLKQKALRPAPPWRAPEILQGGNDVRLSYCDGIVAVLCNGGTIRVCTISRVVMIMHNQYKSGKTCHYMLHLRTSLSKKLDGPGETYVIRYAGFRMPGSENFLDQASGGDRLDTPILRLESLANGAAFYEDCKITSATLKELIKNANVEKLARIIGPEALIGTCVDMFFKPESVCLVYRSAD